MQRHPTFEALELGNGQRAFPLALEPFLHNRFEMADFARKAQHMGVNYIGICCGGAPQYVRAMAEALGTYRSREQIFARDGTTSDAGNTGGAQGPGISGGLEKLMLQCATFLSPVLYDTYAHITRYIGERLGIPTTLHVGQSLDEFATGAGGYRLSMWPTCMPICHNLAPLNCWLLPL